MQHKEQYNVEPELLLIDELAAMFRVSVVTVRRCIRNGRFNEIPRPMRMHGRLCWYRPAVHQWLMARANDQMMDAVEEGPALV